ncbi:hypothetical protein [Pseudomonas sp.]|uniref:hypothetical protein n=1 Tax=Pseudomonas sp. TaxID=306 RepID=UPI003FD7D811
MTDSLKWLHYDVARSRLLMRIGEVNHLIDQEQAASEPDAAKIVALENELDALVDQSDMLSADDIELTNKIASSDWSMKNK